MVYSKISSLRKFTEVSNHTKQAEIYKGNGRKNTQNPKLEEKLNNKHYNKINKSP